MSKSAWAVFRRASNVWKPRALLFPIVGTLLLALSANAAIVKEVKVVARGAAPVDEASVLAYTSVKPGSDISRSELTRDVKELEKSGRFTFVAAQIEDLPDGVRVIYEVEQKPRISRIEITGAEELGNRKVRDLLELGAGDLVDDATLQYKWIKVRDQYRKDYFPNAEADLKILPPDPTTGLAVVKIAVKEGRRMHVRRIEFPGATSVKDAELREAMKQKKRGFWSWITGSGTYSPDDLDGDPETLRRVFQDRGLLDVKIGEPAITNVGGRYIDISIPVTEGRTYHIGALDIRGASLFTTAELAKQLTNKTSDVASMGAIEGNAKAVRDYYGNHGYIATQVKPVLTPTADGGRVDVAFEVTEGRKAVIREVLIRGNSITKDKVIRRELTIYPDDEYNEAKTRNSERRLRNLGYFSFVNGVPQDTGETTADGKAEKYDIAFELEEQKTGNLLVGAGFSSIDNLIGFVELSQGNFDLFNWPPVGGGQKLKLRGTVGAKRSDIELSFVEPWFLDRKLSLSVDLFRHDSRYYSDEYDQRTTGGNIGLGKALGRYNRVNLIYGLENYDIYNVEDDASDIIKEEEGSRLKSSLTLELARDTRDNFFVPSRGMKSSVSAEIAGGPLGGDTEIYKLQAQASKFWPLWFEHVFNVRGLWSVTDTWGDGDRVPIFDRLFLGGARTLRGFKYRDVGPKDEDGEPIGGKTSGYLTFEYTIPVVEKVRFATYYDVGMVYPESYENSWDSLNSDYGIGVRFDIPNFPIRLDYAWPLEADEFNDRNSGRFQFSLGYGY